MIRKTNVTLKKILIDRGLTQRELARAAGMHEATLSQIVQGAYVPTERQQEKIARILGRERHDLFGDGITA